MIQQHRITFDSIAHSSQPTDLFESPFFDDTQPPSPSASSAPIPIPHHGANNIQWDAFDFNQHSSPPLAYTPSYASFNSFGSNPDDSHNWGGRAINDSSAMEMNLYDDDDRKPNLSSPHFEMDADYDPKEYDGGVEPSPFLLYDDQTNFGPIHTGNSSRSFGFQQQGSVDPPAFSQRSSDEVYGGAPSPGSTDGSPDDHSRPHSRSRASSVGAHSFHNSPNLSQLDSFKDLNFDPSTEIPNWAFAPQQQQPNVLSHPPSPHMPSIALHATGPGSSPPRDAPSPPNGPRSPPQLLIPEDTPSLFPPGGGLTAPGINIVPSTPVSGGGAAGTTVPFQHVLGNQLGRQAMVNGAMSQANMFAPPMHARPRTEMHSEARGEAAAGGWGAAAPGGARLSALGGGAAQPPSALGYQPAQAVEFPTQSSFAPAPAARAFNHNLLGYSLVSPPLQRPRSNSDSASSRPQWPVVPSQVTVNPSDILSSSFAQASMLDNTTFLHPNSPHVDLLGNNSLRRSQSASHRRRQSEDLPGRQQQQMFSQNEDFIRMITSADGNSLIPPDPHSPPPSGSSGGAVRRRHSHGHKRGQSLGGSPYSRPSHSPSPSHSPGPSTSALPTIPTPTRPLVTTAATSVASKQRRTTDAPHICPVPGCGSTFTRKFNLNGHMRSHNDDRPYRCQWEGCGKGFARQHDCKRHEALHLNIRPYTCEGCNKQFARMDALNRHLKSDGGIDCAKIHGPTEGTGSAQQSPPDSNSGWPMSEDTKPGTNGNTGFLL